MSEGNSASVDARRASGESMREPARRCAERIERLDSGTRLSTFQLGVAGEPRPSGRGYHGIIRPSYIDESCCEADNWRRSAAAHMFRVQEGWPCEKHLLSSNCSW